MKKEQRIYLRAFEPDDYKTTIAWRNDDEINTMIVGMKRFVSEAYEAQWTNDSIFHSKDVKLAICLKENGKHIGNVYMAKIDEINQCCAIGILLGNKEYWGKGYGCEALRMAVEYMFDERNMQRIEADVLQSNVASQRMHKKVGFREEGLKRRAIYKNGRFQNLYIFSLLKEEYVRV